MLTQHTATRRFSATLVIGGDDGFALDGASPGYVAAADVGGTRIRMILAGLDGEAAPQPRPISSNEPALPQLRSSALGTGAQLFGAVTISLAGLGKTLRC